MHFFPCNQSIYTKNTTEARVQTALVYLGLFTCSFNRSLNDVHYKGWLLSMGLEGMWEKTGCALIWGIILAFAAEAEENHAHLSHESRCNARELNPLPSEYEARMLASQLQCSVTQLYYAWYESGQLHIKLHDEVCCNCLDKRFVRNKQIQRQWRT